MAGRLDVVVARALESIDLRRRTRLVTPSRFSADLEHAGAPFVRACVELVDRPRD
jgi:hypothetical protein